MTPGCGLPSLLGLPVPEAEDVLGCAHGKVMLAKSIRVALSQTAGPMGGLAVPPLSCLFERDTPTLTRSSCLMSLWGWTERKGGSHLCT